MLNVADELDRFVEAYIPLAGYAAARPGSPSETEEQAGLPHSVISGVAESVLQHARRAALWKTYAGLDCVEGIVPCIRTVTSFLAVYPLARTAMEAFASAAWLLEPGISPEERAYRGLLDHKESLEAQRRVPRKRAQRPDLYGDEQAKVFADAVAHYDHQLGLLQTDIENLQCSTSSGSAPQPLGPTKLVERTLDDATEEEGVGIGYYSELSALAHAGSDATNHLVNSGSTADGMNVSLILWVTPLLATCYVMHHCLNRRAEHYALPSPDPHLEPVLDALHSTARLPPETLLLVAPPDRC